MSEPDGPPEIRAPSNFANRYVAPPTTALLLVGVGLFIFDEAIAGWTVIAVGLLGNLLYCAITWVEMNRCIKDAKAVNEYFSRRLG